MSQPRKYFNPRRLQSCQHLWAFIPNPHFDIDYVEGRKMFCMAPMRNIIDTHIRECVHCGMLKEY